MSRIQLESTQPMQSKENLYMHEKKQSDWNIEMAQMYHFLSNNNQMEVLELKNIITKKEKNQSQ